MDVLEHNRVAWDALVEKGDRWTVPVSRETIDAAREGRWDIVLTPTKPVPRSWLDVTGRQVLCLASGGGQQGPILAAAGATVTVLDNSPRQLERDATAAEQYGLPITTIPAVYIFDLDLAERTRQLEVKNPLPYSDAVRPADEPLEFSHTLEEQIGGQIAAGFAITGMYEDLDTSADGYALNRFMSTFMATRALKPVSA